MIQPIQIPPFLERVLTSSSLFHRAYLVGGCVRDSILQIPVKDFDVEVFGTTYEELRKELAPWGKSDLVGKSFGVIKLRSSSGEDYDFSIPRRDSKVTLGHKGFEVSFDPSLEPFEASSRRDFTINSLMYHPATREWVDHHGGLEDLKSGVLRHTSSAFSEDPLRVLRAFQFVARFGFRVSPETVELCRSMIGSYAELPVERVREEWIKWAVKSKFPGLGLQFLSNTGWLQHFQELQALQGTPQDSRWHPEGDVWVHTCFCCDALCQVPEFHHSSDDEKLCLMMAVLSHDLGKAVTTEIAEEGGHTRIRSPGHETEGVALAQSLMTRIGMTQKVIENVLPLVQNHMITPDQLNERGVRRLSRRLEPATIPQLCLVMKADRGGRPPKVPKSSEDLDALLEKARALTVDKSGPKPLIQGRHLILKGWKPGPAFKDILNEAYEAQLDGKFGLLEEAEQWLSDRLSR